jgi:acetolactate synthase-1/2/3 large subunit
VAQLAGADLVLLVACRAPWYPPSQSPAPGAEIVVIDEVPQRPHVVYQVLHADRYLEGTVTSTLRALCDDVAGRDDVDAAAVDERRARVQAAHDELRAAIDADEEKARAVTDRITPALLAAALRDELGDQAVFVDETITHSRILQRHLRWNDPDRWHYVQGGLGQGTAVALGVKQALGERLVVLTIGDGSFLYNPVVQALMASRDLELPLLIVVFNNRQYLSMKLNHLRFYPDGAAVAENDFDGVSLAGQPELSRFGEPFGMPGWEVSSPAELPSVLREAAAAASGGSTAIVNVAVRQAR